MTIRKGEPWGSAVERPAALRTATSDAQLASWLVEQPDGDYEVVAGDLHRTVGAPDRRPDPTTSAHRLPIDVLRIVTDRSEHLAVAHVVVRRRWWRGPIVFVGNVSHLGSWNVAPRAHPNDGRLDVVELSATMRLRERWEARRRLPTGTHVPHPAISVRSATSWSRVDPRGVGVWVDGVGIGRRTCVEVVVCPDAAAIHI